jgi:hypothetical protein
MLHLVGQKLALANAGHETAFMSPCMIAAQLVMLPMALLVGAKVDAWGRKPFYLAAFIVLPLRGFLYTISDNSGWLVIVQLLDRVGNGLFATQASLSPTSCAVPAAKSGSGGAGDPGWCRRAALRNISGGQSLLQ